MREKIAIEICNPNQEREFKHLCKKNQIMCLLKDSEGKMKNEKKYPMYFVLDYKDIFGLMAMICSSKEIINNLGYIIETFKIYKKMIKVEER